MIAPFVSQDGSYAGGFDKGRNPEGTVEVPVFPASAQQIWDFEAGQYGGVSVRADDVRAEAYRRITAVYPLWEQINRNRTGDGAAAMNAWIDSVRTASDNMEASPPSDYTDDQYWPDAP